MIDKYPHVFSPMKIGPVEVKNRMFIPPHGLTQLITGGPHGSMVPTEDYAYYLAERAKGGVALLCHPMTAYPRIRNSSPLFEESIPHFRAVADIVHRNGAKLFAQIHMREGGAAWEPLGAMAPLMGPSEEQNFTGHSTIYQMTKADIADWVEATGRCARNIAEAGYDGVEFHVSHGMLAEMFLSPYFNKRTDEYGGSLDGRMRLLVESLRSIRANLRDDMAAGIRLNCDEMLPGGLTQDDAREVLRKLVALGLIHFADLDIAVEPQQGPLMVASQFLDPLHILSFSAPVGEVVKGKIAIIGAAGRVTSLAQAEQIIASGQLDMVGAVRAHIAEPMLIKNTLEGREDRNRPCIACNFCLGGVRPGHVGWGCVVNPATGRERKWGVSTYAPVASAKKVVIVGAGPAGMEAARTAAKLGHDVVVFERRAKIGGALNLWGSLPRRDLEVKVVDWYRRELAEIGVPVRTGVEATAAMVLAEKPDAVLVATGSRYERTGESSFMPAPIPGWDRDFVYTPEQILEGGARPKGRVLLLEEERTHAGVGIAEVLGENGAKVEIVTRDFQLIGQELVHSGEFVFIVPKLVDLGVTFTIASYVKEIGDHTATVFHVLTNAEETREVDAVVLATMRRADPKLGRDLAGKVPQLFSVGDALSPRLLFEATYEGHRFARLIGVDGAPRDMSEALGLFQPLPEELMMRGAARLREPVEAR